MAILPIGKPSEDKARQVLQQQADCGCALRPPAALQGQDDDPEVTLDSTHVGVLWREKEDSYYAEVRQDGARRTRRFKANDDKLAAKRLAVQWRRAEKEAMTKRKAAGRRAEKQAMRKRKAAGPACTDKS